MKLKTEFVTNSSCASFTIPLKCLSKKQIEMIENHIDYGILLLFEFTSISDKWKIWKTETDGMLHGDTTMDNFDMLRFLLQVVKIDDDVVKYCGCYGDCD